MAAALLQKILKKPPPATLIRAQAFLKTPHHPDILANPFPHLHQIPNPNPSAPPAPPPPVRPNLQIYPTFPHWISLDPIAHPAPASERTESGDEDRMVWADSVKKKRKRKMNKHKLQKLRKSLRRKT